MGYMTIKFSCGHEADVEISGNTATKANRAAYLALDICPKCRAAQREEARKAARKALKEQMRAANPPELKGTARQVSWAEDIRTSAFAAMDAYRNRIAEKANAAIAAKPEKREKLTAQQAALDQAIVSVLSNDEARYWIDNRNSDFVQIVHTAWRAIWAQNS